MSQPFETPPSPNSANLPPIYDPNLYSHPALDAKWESLSKTRAERKAKPELAERDIYHPLEGRTETSEKLKIIESPLGYQQLIARIKVPTHEVKKLDGTGVNTSYANLEVYQAVGGFAPKLLSGPRSQPSDVPYETAMPGEVTVIGAQDAKDLAGYNELTPENRKIRMEDAPPDVTVIQPGGRKSFGRSPNHHGSSVIGSGSRMASNRHFDIEVGVKGVKIIDRSQNGTIIEYRPDIEQLPEMKQDVNAALQHHRPEYYSDETRHG